MDGGFLFSKPAGRIGLGTKFPPQLGQTPFNLSATQSQQNVHSKEQIIASGESGGKSLSQHSQPGFNASIFSPMVWVHLQQFTRQRNYKSKVH
jgi:hypothetical protein